MNSKKRRKRQGSSATRGMGKKTRFLLEQAVEIVAACAPITVRGVGYKLFVAGVIPSMAKTEVDKVGKIILRAREHGIIAWEAIVDESRAVERVTSWDNTAAFADTVSHAYRKDYWTTQDYNLQVWSEKATIGGVLRPVTRSFGVPFMAVHGFGSATVVHDLADASAEEDRDTYILYVGDHDASGMYMSEMDLPARIARYAGAATVERIALLQDDLPGLPSFPVKRADPRYQWYVEHYGQQCWEVDALDPNVLRDRVREAIETFIDVDAWERMRVVEEAEKRSVVKVANSLRSRVTEDD